MLNLTWFACMALYQHGNIRFGAGESHPFELFDIVRALGFSSWGNPLIGPLWFVKTLLIFVLSLPLFAWIRKRGKTCACIVYVAQYSYLYASAGHWDGQGGVAHKPYGIWCFLMGVTFRLYGLPSVSKTVALWLLAVCMGIKATFNLSFDMDNTHLTGVMWLLDFIVRPGMLLGVWAIIPDIAWSKVLTSNTFPIYALHEIFVRMSFIVFSGLKIHDAVFGSFVWSIIYICALLVITIGSAQVLRKNRHTARLFLGGR